MTRAARRWAIVPAAGRGERFGGGLPKQYVRVLGRPVLSWSLSALLAETSVAAIVVAIAAGDRRFARIPEARDPRVRACRGGDRREGSVANALESLAGEARDEDWVLVHDAARPCLRPADVQALLAGVGDDPVGGLLAVPLGDTLKVAGADRRSERTVPREGLWRALTPQMFRYGVLRRALALCRDRARTVTDEAAAIEALGLRPLLVQGHGDNIKVTHPEDRALAAAILRVEGRGAG
jgi:2-C-methyl-D-erythritol 4-phosphate cytidylyltransferase